MSNVNFYFNDAFLKAVAIPEDKQDRLNVIHNILSGEPYLYYTNTANTLDIDFFNVNASVDSLILLSGELLKNTLGLTSIDLFYRQTTSSSLVNFYSKTITGSDLINNVLYFNFTETTGYDFRVRLNFSSVVTFYVHKVFLSKKFNPSVDLDNFKIDFINNAGVFEKNNLDIEFLPIQDGRIRLQLNYLNLTDTEFQTFNGYLNQKDGQYCFLKTENYDDVFFNKKIFYCKILDYSLTKLSYNLNSLSITLEELI